LKKFMTPRTYRRHLRNKAGLPPIAAAAVVITDGARHEFLFTGDDRFQSAAGGSSAVFEREDEGSIAALSVAGLRLPVQPASAPDASSSAVR
jgi:hypothetical protein